MNKLTLQNLMSFEQKVKAHIGRKLTVVEKVELLNFLLSNKATKYTAQQFSVRYCV